MTIRLSLACGDYDRTRAVLDGRVGIEGCDVTAIALDPEEAFHRAFKGAEFDVTELSMSSHMMATSRGAANYVGVPAFVSRVFRHSAIYVRTDRGIKSPADLRGKRVGAPEYQMTAVMWVRGILADEYGVQPEDIHWRTGGQEQPGRTERSPLSLPPAIDLQRIPADRTLVALFEEGELDALITARVPSSYAHRKPHIDRLFPDFRTVEADYYRKTGLFPIMHLIGVRKSLVEQHPWLPVSVFKAFETARRMTLAEIDQISALRVTVPWIVADVAEARALMGDDYWSYGIPANRKALEAMIRYSVDQHLAARPIELEELFAPTTFQLAAI
jgi:4,5-dihydroxyphthalate decarboxylase